jgi:RAD51-like protein 3
MRRSTGLELLRRASASTVCVETGVAGLDDALKGGYLGGEVTELVGQSSTGKTQLCHAAAAAASVSGGGVLYVDTSNSFAPKRLLALVEERLARRSGASEPIGQDLVHRALGRVARVAAFDHETAMRELTIAWRAQVTKQAQRAARPLSEADAMGGSALPLRLIVVDSVTALVRPILGGDRGAQGHAAMMELGQLLLRISRSLRCAVLVTNGTVVDRSGATDAAARGGAATKPALGPSWACVPHSRLLLGFAGGARRSLTRPETQRCTLTVLKCSRARRAEPLALETSVRG